jgi:hypothetical protein
MSLKIEISRRIAKSRPVCMDLKRAFNSKQRYSIRKWHAKLYFNQNNFKRVFVRRCHIFYRDVVKCPE